MIGVGGRKGGFLGIARLGLVFVAPGVVGHAIERFARFHRGLDRRSNSPELGCLEPLLFDAAVRSIQFDPTGQSLLVASEDNRAQSEPDRERAVPPRPLPQPLAQGRRTRPDRLVGGVAREVVRERD